MSKRLFALAVVLVLAAGPALARHCPQDMAQIDAALAANPKISAEQMAEVKRLRAEGEALHKAGNHPESEAKLGQAKKILGIM